MIKEKERDMVKFDVNDPFAGMGDDVAPAAIRRAPGEHLAETLRDPTKMWPETCPSCRGSGRFVSWSGRVVGECFKCKGAGRREFKSSPDDRARAREKSMAKRVGREDANWAEFKSARPELSEWIERKAPTFDFAAAMLQAVKKWGDLTVGQLTTVERLMTGDSERQAAKVARSVGVDAAQVRDAFEAARSKGLSRVKVSLASPCGVKFVVTPAGASSANPGALYVKSDGEYIGKVTSDGRFMPASGCDDERRDAFVAAAADARGAAVAYGRLTGNCSCCGRELTREDSIAAGIGPICASRMGW